MTITTLDLAPTDGQNGAYNLGYTEGELDALEKLPAAMADNRAALADDHDPLWAQGYMDGYLAEIARNYAYLQKEQAP